MSLIRKNSKLSYGRLVCSQYDKSLNHDPQNQAPNHMFRSWHNVEIYFVKGQSHEMNICDMRIKLKWFFLLCIFSDFLVTSAMKSRLSFSFLL